METIPLALGELNWVFPEMDDPEAVRTALAAADDRLRALAGSLGKGDGLTFRRIAGFELAGVYWSVEVSGVSFSAWLGVPRRCPWDLRAGPPWDVEAEILLWCDPEHCAGHQLGETGSSHNSPAGAALALAEAAQWLLGRHRSTPVATWRSSVTRCQ